MNHIYRSIWNEKTGTFVAVSENTKTGGKKASAGASVVAGAGFALKALAVSLLLAFGSNSYALPVNGVIVAGSATVTSGVGSMNINQTSQNAVLNWQSFNIGAGEAVHFVQPNSSSVALNRVLGADPSRILGSLSANGKVFIVNPNGILFGKGASVNVGGLVASTLNISDSDFMAGKYKFAGAGNGSVLNQGTINADGGYVALLGANVSNEGTINARLGTVTLAVGNAITLDVVGDGLLNVTVDQGAVNALVQNGGMIQADGGQVLLTAQAAGNLLQTVVNNTGIIQAQTIENHNGTIKLLGDMQSGTVNAGGKLDASAPAGGNGGFIETSAAQVKVVGGTQVTTAAASGLTGSWLIDPVDYNIAATGGNITGAALSSSLASTNVTILSSSGSTGTSGNVNVNDSVTWSANKLTLNAQNNININAAMKGSGSASLALQYGQGAVSAGNTSTINVNATVNLPSGNTLSTTQGSNGIVANYTVITSLGAAGSSTGTDLQGMRGNLAANYALGGDIDASATSGWNAGAGFAPVGNSSTKFTGVFNGLGHTINNMTINLPGSNYVGLFGMVGTGGTVQNVGLIGGSVTAGHSTGALMGQNNGTVRNSYATGSVTGSSFAIGGLIGQNYGTISNSYATGAVAGSNYVGGLLGAEHTGGILSNSYATGTVSAGNHAGGLLGINDLGTVNSSYASGAVSGANAGGLMGQNSGTITNSYWNSDISGATGIGVGTATGATGLASVQMKTASNFAGFTFTTTPGATGNNWVMVDVDSTLNNAGGALGGTRPMLASEYSTTINNAHQLQLMAMNLAGKYTVGQNITATATGTTNDVWSGSTFIPVGNNNTLFTGTFNGLGNTINNLVINLPSSSYIGLFGANGGLIQNVGLIGGSVTGGSYAGGLAGNNANSNALITNSYNTGSVSGSSYLGGIAGQNWSGSITNSYATGAITGTGNNIGGLVGYGHNSATIINSYATGNVSGGAAVGGLMGSMNKNSAINNSYATGSVTTCGQYCGGLIGSISSGAGVSNSYSTGAVTGGSQVGGLIGATGSGTGASNSFWDTQSSGQATSAGGVGATGRTTAQMKTASALSGLDFTNTWVIYDTYSNPLLRSFMTALTVTANSATKSFDGAAYSGGNGVTYSVTPGGGLLGSLSYSGSAQGAVNAGSYAIAPSGLYSTSQQGGYAVTYVNAPLTVSAANLTLSTSNVSKTYDGGLTAAGAASVTSGTLFGTDSISGGTFAFTDKNVGSGNKTVTASGVTVSDGNGGSNYQITYANNTTSTITRLNSVTWTGGVTGNWFDPANWAGGAVPDLSNVANVIIPAGVTVSFNNGNVVSPAQAGAVNVDSIGSLGGMNLATGSLSVANSLQLANLVQSGGTLNSTGNVNVNNFNQTGGSTISAGNFTAINSFSQSGGTVNAGGNVSITQTSGSVAVGNITTGGTLGVTAVTGDIVQAAGTSIVAGGTATLTAPNGNIALVSSGNNLGKAIVSSGAATKIQNAVTNAVSAALINSNGDNASNSLVSFGQGGLPGVASGNSIQNMLAGLNVSITGSGLNLPDGVQVNDSTDDKK